MRVPIVIFAQIPPPEHGQSRMVQLALETLREVPEHFDVHHVNARFSSTLEDIGESSLGKLLLSFRYLAQALRLRQRLHDPLLYYVPGPVKWSSVLRDWVLLLMLRICYRRVVFHWHAIGQGEWAHGSNRLAIDGPAWLDRLARAASRRLLQSPYASIAVSETSQKDSIAVGSRRCLVIHNGIQDPCPDFEMTVEPARQQRCSELVSAASPCFRILFLSHGTLEKGLLDAVDALRLLLEKSDPQWRFEATFAGGVSEVLEVRFDRDLSDLQEAAGDRLALRLEEYVSGEAKQRCYLEHDIFLSPSHWESFGLTVVEAMAYGMRVVAAASDGVRGILPQGYPYLAPVASTVDLAERLKSCCNDLLAMPACGMERELRQRYLSNYQLKDFSSNLIIAFRELGHSGGALATGAHDESVCGPEIADRRSEMEDEEAAPHSLRTPLATSGRAEPARPTDPRSTIRDPRSKITSGTSSSSLPLITDHSALGTSISLSVYLADQNPGHDRSFGISRMTQVVLEALLQTGGVELETISSKTSQQAPAGTHSAHVLPWGTRHKWMRLLTDHFHPLFHHGNEPADVHYFPKGYLPWWRYSCRPSVVTIHDTIIQYDEDHYPQWRKRSEYAYWARMLKHTLRHADYILTVSESSKRQIRNFMERHGIPRNDITVTYEPCIHERLPQPEQAAKENYVIHLASCEPHKRTAHLIRWWHEAERDGRQLPTLHLIGSVPPEVETLLTTARTIVKRPFLDDSALQAAYLHARALILPSEIEGFGLPALEAYYLGTPVCYVKGTSVEEVLAPAAAKGGFTLDSKESLFFALDEVMSMSTEDVRQCGLKLREIYAADKVVERMLSVFHGVKK